MTESKPIYLSDPVETPLVCPACYCSIGMIVEVAGKPWLKIGESRLYAVHGLCGCGAELHWNAGDVTLARLIKRSRRRKCLHSGANGI